jgi:hypothetical protein
MHQMGRQGRRAKRLLHRAYSTAAPCHPKRARAGPMRRSSKYVGAAEQSPPGVAWKAIAKTYLSLDPCEQPERGCPLSALSPGLARADK